MAEGAYHSLAVELEQARHHQLLDLSNVRLEEIPDEIRDLTHLRVLLLDQNMLRAVPSWFAELPSLEVLGLSGNRLNTLPRSLSRLKKLRSLSLNTNPLGRVPDVVRELPSLVELGLSRCGLSRFPAYLGELPNLRRLDISHNPLERMPEAVRSLKSLVNLNLASCQLPGLPSWIGELDALDTLDLVGNGLMELPMELGRLPHLRDLRVNGNPLPPEVLAAVDDGDNALIAYLSRLYEEGEQIHEAKLVSVGEGAVGKSSLLAALRGEEFVEGRDTTHGIEVKPLEVYHDGTSITLNGWDFGGQPVYRPTHQLFFSAPAVYVVAWKPRQGSEQGFVDYWIGLIRHRVGTGARIHVVATHGGPRQRSADLDQMRLREKHGDAVVDFQTVDNETGSGIPELKAALAATAASLPHVGRTFPRSWRRLRTALTEDGRPYVPYAEYERLAASEGLSQDDARSLVRMSHSLGHWVHYGDDPGLSELVVLKPDWLSRAISFMLDDGETARANGLLPHRRLPAIWDDPRRPPEDRYPLDVQRLFLGLMEKFDLTYRVGVDDLDIEPTSLVGQLVPGAAPDLGPWAEGLATSEEELTQVCHVTEADTGTPVVRRASCTSSLCGSIATRSAATTWREASTGWVAWCWPTPTTAWHCCAWTETGCRSRCERRTRRICWGTSPTPCESTSRASGRASPYR